ncbi:hypothetical protein D3C84_910000 [compost metagenome]
MPLLSGDTHVSAKVGRLIKTVISGLDTGQGGAGAKGDQRTAKRKHLGDQRPHTAGHHFPGVDDMTAKGGEVFAGAGQLLPELGRIQAKRSDQAAQYGHRLSSDVVKAGRLSATAETLPG